MAGKVLHIVVLGLLKVIASLPFRALYLLSDCSFPVVYHLVRYRRKVVETNLLKSFPEKSHAERRLIVRRYYRFLCDLTLESLKVPKMGNKEIAARMKVLNPELLNKRFAEGKSVIVLAVHHGNWEWVSSMPLVLHHCHFFVYKPLQDARFDRYLNTARERFGGKTVSMNIALRKLIEAEREHKPVLTWLAADQTPPWFHPFWTVFMHQEAMFFNGPAKLAKRFNHPVYYQHVKRIRRGYYETWFELLFDQPTQVSEEELILTYVKKVEQTIADQPECYLWSHRRWKYKRPAHLPIHIHGAG